MLQVHTKSQIQHSISPVKGSSPQAPQRNLILGAGSEALTVYFSALFQVFLHRLNQYAATKIDKNITEETVKVRVHHCGVRWHNHFLILRACDSHSVCTETSFSCSNLIYEKSRKSHWKPK